MSRAESETLQTDRPKLKPGESRVVRVLPCPPEWMAKTNEYYRLKNAARRLHESLFELMWDSSKHRLAAGVLDAIVILRNLAREQPVTPIRTWYEQSGEIKEICCPVCEHVFEWQGNFYAPQCPNCKRFLNERRAEKGKVGR